MKYLLVALEYYIDIKDLRDAGLTESELDGWIVDAITQEIENDSDRYELNIGELKYINEGTGTKCPENTILPCMHTPCQKSMVFFCPTHSNFTKTYQIIKKNLPNNSLHHTI